MSRTKIGLFGGTFDPPHIGHLTLASEAARQLKLSRVLWALAPNPPHKQGHSITPLSHRLEMLKLMIASNSIFEISDLELNRPGPHYTIDTVRLLAQQEPDAELILLLGGDSLRDLPTWRLNINLVAEVSKIGVMRRPGDSFDLHALESKIPGLIGKVCFIDTLLKNVSSREIRSLVMKNEVYDSYVIPSVYQYIESHSLYRRK